MNDSKQPTQAMPDDDAAKAPQPTQPTDKHRKPEPLSDDDEGFGGFMGHGGQTDISDETEEAGGNPNATAQSD
jgi:hypothetical protein